MESEDIAVTQGPIAPRLHLFQGPARVDGQLWRPCEKLKGNFSCPAESHTITQDQSKEEHFGGTKRKAREEERVNEKVKPAVWKCLVFTAARAHSLATIKRPICFYRNI